MSTDVAETVSKARQLVVPLNASYEEAVRHYEQVQGPAKPRRALSTVEPNPISH